QAVPVRPRRPRGPGREHPLRRGDDHDPQHRCDLRRGPARDPRSRRQPAGGRPRTAAGLPGQRAPTVPHGGSVGASWAGTAAAGAGGVSRCLSLETESAMSKLRRIPGRLIGKVRRWLPSLAARGAQDALSNTDYWTGYNVTGHCQFTTRAQSLDFLRWRNGQYLFYDEL